MKTKRDLICFSHLPWHFVYQRPQHLMSRAAKTWRVFFFEAARVGMPETRLEIREDPSGVIIATPHISKEDEGGDKPRLSRMRLLDELVQTYTIKNPVFWYYTPVALPYSRHMKPSLIVYDCMDELSAFKGAAQDLPGLEEELLGKAGLVFTGGFSLYEAKKNRHPDVHCFPSSIDSKHFAQARAIASEPEDQQGIPHPRLGYFGVIDERMDYRLLSEIAEARPDWSLVMVGPLAKVDETELPKHPNIYYLGMKDYKELPAYLAGWDVAIMPFALNEATRFISPTKTPEYLAGGKPVISTPIRDVVSPYGENGLIWIAKSAFQFVECAKAAFNMNGRKANWLERVDEFLKGNSWDDTWENMDGLIRGSLDSKKQAPRVKRAEMSKHAATPVKAYSGRGKKSAGSQKKGSGREAVASASTLVSGTTTRRDDEIYEADLSLEDELSGEESIAMPPITVKVPSLPQRRKTTFDFLIVGAGFAGSVLAERLARGSGKKVLVIDRRNHIAGNAYDHYDDAGILVHKYGPHIFHTNSREVFAYLSQFTKWRPYEHRVRASVDGQLVPMPINLDTVNQLYGLNLTSFELEKFFESVAERVDKVETSEDVVVSKVGRQLYEKFFRNYTRKQWDLDPSELDASVTSRVPIRFNRDDRYFTDIYQAMPLYGYTRMFENILDHPNIKVMLNTDYREVIDFISYKKMIYTGPVDEYFDFRYGKLPYRSLHFKFETVEREQAQPVAVINYPNEHAYTRVTEFKHLTGQQHPKSSLVYEYPCSEGDPYYPIPRPENAELYRRYKSLADNTEDVYFAGRLATYRYYNMDQVVAQVLTLYSRISGTHRGEAASNLEKQTFSVDLPCSLLVPEEVG
jgi:UDP-galactopyranose mutase